MRSADTNLVVRLIVRDEPTQARAAKQFAAEGLWISTLVLAEASWVLRRTFHIDPMALADSVEMFIGSENAVLQDPEVVANALELFREQPGLGFSDCLILELARKAGHLPLGTFDRKLSKVDGAQLV